MNQWLLAGLIFWLGTGSLIVLGEWVTAWGKKASKR